MPVLWKKIASGVALVLGFILVGLGALTLLLLPGYFKRTVTDEAQLKRNADGSLGEIAEKWAKPSVSAKVQYTFYNVENPTDFYKNGHKLRVTMKGPYVFRQERHKDGIQFADDGKSVSYESNKTYHFEPDSSCPNCTDEDLITIPNILYMGIIDKMRHRNAILKAGVNVFVIATKTTPFVTHSVRQLLYEGYDDKLLTLVRNLMPELPDKVALFYKRNGSADGVYVIRTGIEGPNTLGDIISWRNRTSLPADWWLTPQARMLNGSDGALWHPFLKRGHSMPVFVSDICRSVNMSFVGDSQFRSISAYRYTLSASVFDPSLEANRGFRLPTSDAYFNNQSAGEPLPIGFLNVSRCQPGHPPIVMSFPRFLFSTNESRERVEGVDEPQSSQDQTFLDIEPTTGVLLNVTKQLQINIAMHRDSSFNLMDKLPNTIVPVVIIKELTSMGDSSYDKLKAILAVRETVVPAVAYTLLVIGFVVIVLISLYAIVILYRLRKLRRSESRASLPSHDQLADDQSVVVDPSDTDGSYHAIA